MPELEYNNLFIFEMANNHMGDVDHGLKIIHRFARVRDKFSFPCGFKFQYRDIETFIHPDYASDFSFKYVKRFTETRFPEEHFLRLKEEMDRLGFISICTPFDEISVDRVAAHDFAIVKIASCSFTDWPLLEKIATLDKPVIASTAGARLEDIDRVVAFFQHRSKQFALMHCVGEYPTRDENLHLGQIDLFRHRYPNITIGYSTHEDPDNMEAIRIAIAKGAQVFERHVGVPTRQYRLNPYSSTPEQMEQWMGAAAKTLTLCGVSDSRRPVTEKEASDLRGLQRGVFLKKEISAGKMVQQDDLFFAIPNFPDQLLANDLSKYLELTAKRSLPQGAPLLKEDVIAVDRRDRILDIVRKVRTMLINARIHLPDQLDFEISHHYGIDRFDEYGAVIINCINREYCKKLIILLPGQRHPMHYHKKKEETFQVLYGDLVVDLGAGETTFSPGDLIVVQREQPHSFRTEDGAICEEVSTTHYRDDSFYDDKTIMTNHQRKTAMTFWIDWLDREPT